MAVSVTRRLTGHSEVGGVGLSIFYCLLERRVQNITI